MTQVTIRATFHSDIQRVWDAVLDVGHYAAWRGDLSKTEVLDETRFVEYTKEGYPTTFTVTAVEPCKRWEFDMENSNMKGHWTGLFTAKDDGVEVEFTECVTAKKFFMKPFVRSFLKKQQVRFIADLQKALDGDQALSD